MEGLPVNQAESESDPADQIFGLPPVVALATFFHSRAPVPQVAARSWQSIKLVSCSGGHYVAGQPAQPEFIAQAFCDRRMKERCGLSNAPEETMITVNSVGQI
jgi:hypothetical protein